MSTAVRSTLQLIHDKEGAEVCVDVMQHFMLYVMSGKAFGIHQKSLNKLTRVTKQRLKEIEKAKDEIQ